MSSEENKATGHHEQGVPVHTPQELTHEPPPVRSGSVVTILVIVIVIAVVLAVFGILKRKHSEKSLDEYTQKNSAPPVTLLKPVLQQSAREIVIPGNMQAFTLAPIYARTTGYVKSWHFDIGSHVHKGDLLAVIETPELDQQLMQARADLATAKSNAGIAKITASRYGDLIGSNAVSQQDTDNAVSQSQARNAEVTSAEANVHRLEELQSFERILAPFDGVITARNVDIGQLISATGSTTTAVAGAVAGSKEIFDMAAINTLRVFVNVPQVYAPDAKKGVTATLTLPQYPGRTFKGTLVRTSNAVDPTTRTLLAEVDVDNRTGELLPGSYTEVHLNVSNAAPALVVPVSAVILEADGLHVATVDATNHTHIVRVVPGRDSGSSIEILSGLAPDQTVIANPPDSLTDGELVHVVNGNGGKAGQAAGTK
jgi:RND family efflux transporter MFP subunit